MTNYRIPKPINEPVLDYLPGSLELQRTKEELDRMSSTTIKMPLIIGGERIYTEETGTSIIPHSKDHILGSYSMASKEHVEMAIQATKDAKEEWEFMDWYDRASIFLKAADLLAGPYRPILNAATMLGQSKNILQAEIDAACELIDFWRFNTNFMQQIYDVQPDSSAGIWNRVEYRPLEGFVFAVTPFNFTSIAGNLPTAPAMMGNTVIFKPASSSVFSGYYIMEILEAAGLPSGVINFLPGKGSVVGPQVLNHRDLAGIHFTGSTPTFRYMWKTVGENIENYKNYPRIVGETGGKDFIFMHSSAVVEEVVAAIIRGSFEYAGQKCSASSRAYIPKSRWVELKEILMLNLQSLKTGDPIEVSTLVNAVIDQDAFESISRFISYAEESTDAEIIFGGKTDDSIGFFIDPTVILAKTADFKTMKEEIFGPVLTIYLYDDDKYEETLELCDNTSDYALTGAIFAINRKAIRTAFKMLRHAAGNFYINDKPTGAVVNQQPFGGSRASGTNDKAGSLLNLIRWTSPRSIKETFVPSRNWDYPYMRS
ncbi:MAG: 1-pyrroline-5-carboxylate dehydrogenase [Candidatus Heimdallarchaeota archaeon LC_2]|nr:MAG: 1-pyrroline-5-carboxylate dehydrogenase [Candidatus Heimdallarchaeota archaeon LC_2]